MLYMVTFTINIPQMLAYIPYMDPMGNNLIRSVYYTNSNHFGWWFIYLEFLAQSPQIPPKSLLLEDQEPTESFSDKSQNLVSGEICWTPIFHGSNQLPGHPETFALQMWAVGVAVLLYLALAEFHLAKGWWNTVGPCQMESLQGRASRW